MFTRVWNKKEVEYLRENYGEIPIYEICKELGRTCNAVRSKACKLNLKREFAEESGVKIKAEQGLSVWEWLNKYAHKITKNEALSFMKQCYRIRGEEAKSIYDDWKEYYMEYSYKIL